MDFEDRLYVWRLCAFPHYVFIQRLHNASGSYRITQLYGQYTYRRWEQLTTERMPTGFLPSAPSPAYIRIPLNFIISVAFFSIPWSYLEHIKVASNYHGRLSTVQDIMDQYTRRIVKEYQDFLLIVRLATPSLVLFWVLTPSRKGYCALVVSI